MFVNLTILQVNNVAVCRLDSKAPFSFVWTTSSHSHIHSFCYVKEELVSSVSWLKSFDYWFLVGFFGCVVLLMMLQSYILLVF